MRSVAGASYDADVELCGSLRFSALTDLLLLLEASEQSGVLRLDGESELWFHEGAISYASYVGCPPLRMALVGYRIIGESQWEEAVRAGPEEGTGAALDALPGIPRDRLRTVLRALDEQGRARFKSAELAAMDDETRAAML